MVRWVTFMVCLLLVVDVLVVGGVGDKEKKRSGAGDKSATGEKKPKKQRLAGEAEDRLTREDIMDTILPEVGVQMDSQFLQFEQPYSSSGICVSDDYGLDAEDADDEARIDTFMHNLETGGDTASAGQHTVRFANTNTEPLRLRLRQLRSGDVTDELPIECTENSKVNVVCLMLSFSTSVSNIVKRANEVSATTQNKYLTHAQLSDKLINF